MQGENAIFSEYVCERETEKERERLFLNRMCLRVYLCVKYAKRTARPSIVGL